MDPQIAQREAIVRHLYAQGAWAWYGSVDEALDKLDMPTFVRGIDEYAANTAERPNNAGEYVQPLFCSQPAIAPFSDRVCKWPDPGVSWHTAGGLKGISAADFKAAAEEAWGYWAAVCGIRPNYSTNDRTANVLMHAADLGGPGGTLADSMLPCGLTANNKQMEQRYDGENWQIAETPTGGKLDLVRVICHELGHALGSDHIAAGNLLAPTYNPRVRRPQAGDVAEMVKRYGPPRTDQPPTGPAPTPGKLTLTINNVSVSEGAVAIMVPGHRFLKV